MCPTPLLILFSPVLLVGWKVSKQVPVCCCASSLLMSQSYQHCSGLSMCVPFARILSVSCLCSSLFISHILVQFILLIKDMGLYSILNQILLTNDMHISWPIPAHN